METLEIRLEEGESCGTSEDWSGEEWSIFSRIEERLDYADFFRQHLLANRPCLLSSAFTEDWNARRDFISTNESSVLSSHDQLSTNQSSQLSPNLENIMKLLSQDYSVPVSDCSSRE